MFNLDAKRWEFCKTKYNQVIILKMLCGKKSIAKIWKIKLDFFPQENFIYNSLEENCKHSNFLHLKDINFNIKLGF